MPRDDIETERLRVAIYRRMTPEQRLQIAVQLSEDGIALVRESILAQQPDISPDDLRDAIRERVLPRGLARQVREALARRAAGGSV